MITADILTASGSIPIINKSDEIVEYLNSVGIDHSKINTVHTPFIGANEYTELTVLLATPDITMVEMPVANSEVRDIFTFRIFEESGGGGGGGTTGDSSGGNTTSTTTSQNTGFGLETGSGIYHQGGGGDPEQYLTGATTTATLAGLQYIKNYGRTLLWTNLVCISRYELLISAGSQNQTISTEIPNINVKTKPAVWIYTFVDQRYFLKDLLALPVNGVSQTKPTYFHSKFNVVSENPLHLIPETCQSSKAIEGDKTLSDRSATSTYDTQGIPYRNYWYEQTSFSGMDIFDNLVGILSSTHKTKFGTENIIFEYKAILNSVYQNKYDFIDLDFSGLTIGQAMDLAASRIACVWAWDRRQSKMYLRSTNATFDKNADNVGYWNLFNSDFRSSGGLSSITQEAPSAVYTIHKIKEVTLYGADLDAVCQSYKKSEYVNGVEYDSLGSYYVTTSIRTSGDARRVVCINDHYPAFFGNNKEDNSGFIGASETQDKKTTLPWNYEFGTLGLYKTKDYATSLKERNVALYSRYLNAKNNIGGDITLSRIPVSSSGGAMNTTPSISLSCDFINFNNVSDRQILYRLYGGYEKDLVFPYLKNTSPLVARGIAQTSNQNGVIGIEIPNPSNAIVRSFPCLIISSSEICSETVFGDPIAWKYKFAEVVLSDNNAPDWQLGSYEGKNDRYPMSYCFNMAEAAFIRQSGSGGSPSYNSDGTQLNYKVDSFPRVRVLPISNGTITICYEMIGRKGLTTFHIDKTNGLMINCPPKAPLAPPSPNWNKSNISGVGFTDGNNLASQVQQ